MTAFTAQSTVTPVPTSIAQAIDFLTRPLVLIHAPTKIISLQLILRTTLAAACRPTRQNKQPRITLSLSPASLPPRPIYAACIASSIRWSDWIAVLGGGSFDLVIESDHVFARAGSTDLTIWRAPAAKTAPTTTTRRTPQPALRAASNTAVVQASLLATVDSALARAQARTAVQQLLESAHEVKEAEEMFAMISRTSIMPARESGPPHHHRHHDAQPTPSSPDSSRPSSRASNLSSFSFSSEESTISMSSLGSGSDKALPAAAQADALPTACVYVDSTKTEVTKYSYQGGVSTVLTGGVMLGAAASPTPVSRHAAVSRLPAMPCKTMAKRKAGADSGNWRRTARV